MLKYADPRAEREGREGELKWLARCRGQSEDHNDDDDDDDECFNDDVDKPSKRAYKKHFNNGFLQTCCR